jgi:HlyD family secretion protein
MKNYRYRAGIAAVASGVVVVLVVLVAGCSTGSADPVNGWQTTEAVRGDLRITAEATGTVEPIRRVEVKSKASGEILRLHVDIGDEVEPGTLLAEIDPRDVRNRHDQAAADLEVARARSAISTQQLARQRELLAAGVITQQELESASLEAANAEANLVKAQTNFDLAELQLADVTIRAPLAGTILERNVEEGTVIQSASQNVSGGSVLFVMATLEAMQVRTLVDETDMGDLQAGMETTVRVEAFPDRVFTGTVSKIEPQAVVQQNVTMFPVIVTLDNRLGLLKPGMNAEVEVLIDEATDVLLVPNNAIVNVQDAGPAAMALGLDPETLDLASLRTPTRPAAAEGDTPDGGAGEAGAPAGETAAAGGGRPDLARLREQVQRGEISQDSVRALMARLRAAGGGQGGFARGAAGAAGAAVTRDRAAPRPAVVFVVDAEGVPRPRRVMIALNDWDHTQVVSGLEGDERLAVIGAAQLQAQQQEWLEQVRSRSGGSPLGGGATRRMR